MTTIFKGYHNHFIFILTGLLWLTFSVPTFGQKLVLNTDDEYPRSTLQETGFEDLIIKEAFRRLGKEVKIVNLPSERALLNANQGLDDGNFVRIAGLEKAYPNLIRVPEKICDFEFAAFTKNPAIRITNWNSLKPYEVGIITGWKILEANIVGTRSLTKVNDPSALFQLLVHNRADLVVFDLIQGRALIKEQRLTGIKALKPLLAMQDMFLYLNRRHAALVPKLVITLKAMKRDKTIRGIMNSMLKELEG